MGGSAAKNGRGEGSARAPPRLRQTRACALQRCKMCKQGDGFWLAPGRIKLKRTTSGPNPWFWAQNHGFGPDVVIFGLGGAYTKSDHIWPKPRFSAQEPGFGSDMVMFGCF